MVRSGKSDRKEILKHTNKETNSGNQTVAQKKSFAENESTVKTIQCCLFKVFTLI